MWRIEQRGGTYLVFKHERFVGEFQKCDRCYEARCFFKEEKYFVGRITMSVKELAYKPFKKQMIYMIQKKIEELEQIDAIEFVETKGREVKEEGQNERTNAWQSFEWHGINVEQGCATVENGDELSSEDHF